MKRIDASKDGFFEASWSPDGKWLTYVAGEDEVRLANVETGEMRVVGKGLSPGITKDNAVVLGRDQQIVLVTGGGEKVLLSKKDLVKDTPKQGPSVSPDGSLALASVCNVFDKESQSKNAYAYRHFLAVVPIGGGKPRLTREQWYGGASVWFPDGKRFAHFEFDSTGGPQTHIVAVDGTHEGTLAGLYPSISPDGTRLAVRPRGGGSLVVYTSKSSWNNIDVETSVMRIPGGGETRTSATPPIWLDNRHTLVVESGRIWRIDTKRDKPEEMKKLPAPTERRKHSMIASPSRNMLAIEVEAGEGFELGTIPLS
ncbi:MAG: hypothetical protein GY854_26805 [Deltaproteobacteria bacterium]|nr:hypothetical protein [Deltaproteobacteria bacterium]